jgi:DNA-binding MarR family transcriptional regulator
MVNIWKIILATVIIFGAGVVTGGLLVSHSERVKLRQLRAHLTAAAQPPQWTPPLREFPRRPEGELQLSFEQRRIEFLLSVTRELKLTPEQRQRIEPLLRESQEAIRKLWEPIKPQMRKELAAVTEKIREELTPQQRKRFEELMKRQQTRRAEETSPAGRDKRDGRRTAPQGEKPFPADVPPPAQRPDLSPSPKS